MRGAIGYTAGVAAPETAPRRHVRLFFALSIASLLGTFAVYSVFAADSTPLIGVAEAAAGQYAGEPVKLRGEVADFSGDAASAAGLRILLRTDTGGARETVAVTYRGSVPDAFRRGRQIVVDGRMVDGRFAAQPDSLVTKCPSKFENAKDGSKL